MVECKVDNTIHESLDALHKHLRKFHIKQSDYYQHHFPRKDLLTKELIEYKDYNQYFNQDFKNKINLKKWLDENKDEGMKWAKDWLTKRKNEKDLVYAPSYVELRSLVAPSMEYFDKNGGYYDITESLGFEKRYTDNKLKFKQITNKHIIIDSREQEPIDNIEGFDTSVSALKVGDYALRNNNDIFIERKSLNDFCGTLSQGFDRFDRELVRAKEANSYIVMMIECRIGVALSFNYLPHMRWVKSQPSFIFKQLRELIKKYPLNFQPLFVEGRKDLAQKMVRIFGLQNPLQTIDLQYAYENGDL